MPRTHRIPPNNPGEGYRFLEVGEAIRNGDEFYSDSDEGWRPTSFFWEIIRRRHVCVAGDGSFTYGFYRRRTEQ